MASFFMEVEDGLGFVTGGEFAHASAAEEGVEAGHVGEGFGVAGGVVGDAPAGQQRSKAEGAESGVDDDARDGADTLVHKQVAGGAGEAGEVQRTVADGEVEGGAGEDGDGDGRVTGSRSDGFVLRRREADGPDGGEGGGAVGEVMKAGEAGVIGDATSGDINGSIAGGQGWMPKDEG